jgi:hypothetical protein
MMVTIAPFAAFAIAGISFWGGVVCAAATALTTKIRERSLLVILLAKFGLLFQCGPVSSERESPSVHILFSRTPA